MNPRPSDYKSDALPAELRQPEQPALLPTRAQNRRIRNAPICPRRVRRKIKLYHTANPQVKTAQTPYNHDESTLQPRSRRRFRSCPAIGFALVSEIGPGFSPEIAIGPVRRALASGIWFPPNAPTESTSPRNPQALATVQRKEPLKKRVAQGAPQSPRAPATSSSSPSSSSPSRVWPSTPTSSPPPALPVSCLSPTASSTPISAPSASPPTSTPSPSPTPPNTSSSSTPPASSSNATSTPSPSASTRCPTPTAPTASSPTPKSS